MTRLITLRRLIAPKPLILNQSPLGGSRKALLAPRHTLSHRNYASNSSKAKPLMLEKPARYQSPSHPAAPIVRSPPRQYPGPALSPEDEKRRKTKRYPNTMPAKGTFMYWFLTTRSIHVWITLVRNIYIISPPSFRFPLDFSHIPTIYIEGVADMWSGMSLPVGGL